MIISSPQCLLFYQLDTFIAIPPSELSQFIIDGLHIELCVGFYVDLTITLLCMYLKMIVESLLLDLELANMGFYISLGL